MPKAGSYDYPSRDLDDCLSYLRRARESLRSREMSREGFARSLGQSSSGGGFGKLIGAMTDYALIETGRSRITTTELGEQILYGTENEQRAGRDKSVRKVRLFSELFRKFGATPSDDQLRMFLRDKADLEIAVAKTVAEEIGKLMRKNAPYFLESREEKTQRETGEPSKFTGPLVARLETADYGILNIRDEISMDLAINLLMQVKKSRNWSGTGNPVESTAAPARKKDLPDDQTN
jgi:hypothetical protein